MLLSKAKRRAGLSMTSLIDVIFLLLLFFMLSSTFSKFGEVEITAAGNSAGTATGQTYFLRLTGEGITLNGQALTTGALASSFAAKEGTVLVSVTQSANAQLLTDVLIALRGQPKLSIAVLGGA
jgi:biopolymer transport protein ExbD